MEQAEILREAQQAWSGDYEQCEGQHKNSRLKNQTGVGGLFCFLRSAQFVKGNPEPIGELYSSRNFAVIVSFNVLNSSAGDAGKFNKFWNR